MTRMRTENTMQTHSTLVTRLSTSFILPATSYSLRATVPKAVHKKCAD